MTDHDETVSGSLRPEESLADLPEGLFIVLEVIEGPDQGTRFEIKKTRTALGRKEADVKLSDPTVSGKHAFLEFTAGRLFISDNHSTNHTLVNGEEVESAGVDNLDVIQLGDSKLLVSVLEDRFGAYLRGADEDTGESRLADDEPTLVDAPLPNPKLPANIYVALEVIEGKEAGRKFKIERRSTVIGRGPNADFPLDDPAVSSRHCQIEIHNKDKMTIKDLASANGTRLNGRFVSAVKIRDSDVIQVGSHQLRIIVHVRS